MICSNYHIELNAGDAGKYDEFVVQDIIKEVASNWSLNSGGIISSRKLLWEEQWKNKRSVQGD